MSFCKSSSMHPAITHRHSHVYILDPSGVDVQHGFLYDMALDENWAVEVRFRPWVELLD